MKKDDNSKITGTFADRLADLIVESGKKISVLAREIGVSSGILSSYQNDKVVASITNLKKIADYFEVSCDYLLGGAECKTISNEAILKKIGLSDKSILLLESDIKPNDDYILIVNTLIENESIKKLCCEISSSIKKSSSIEQTLDELNQEFDDLEASSYVFDNLKLLSGEIDSSAEQYQEFLKYRTMQVLTVIVDGAKETLMRHYEKIRNDDFQARLAELILSEKGDASE